MTYQHFAYIYDELMKEVPYEAWLEYFLDRLPEGSTNGRVLDLACGTGSLSIPIAKKGFQVTGIDLSAEMLTVADEKARNEQVSITFLQQDMTDLESGELSYETIVCFCDSINYLRNEAEVISTFKGVYDSLKPEGIFMFDVHSIEKIESIFVGQTFVSNDERISFIWNCFEGEFPFSVEHELTFFVNNSENLYKRYDEMHVQRTFPIGMYETWLKEAGFTSIEITSDFKKLLDHNKRERIFFHCEKK